MADRIPYTNGTNGVIHQNGTSHLNGGGGGITNGSTIFHAQIEHPSDLYRVKDLQLSDEDLARRVSTF